MAPERTPLPGLGRWVPQVTVFMSSFCIMVIELVAGRVVSRHLGSSLYTWTSVIGVVLAGIALGNFVGGRIADRRRATPTLAVLFLVASVTCVTISVLNHQVGNWVFLWSLPWSVRVGSHVAIVFLVPSIVLGMISPVAAKMALDHSSETGRTIGSVYAWGVIGSIVGTFATGFYLIAAFGTAAVIWAVAGTLALMAVLFGAQSWKAWLWSGLLAGLIVLGTGPWAWSRSLGEQLGLRGKLDSDVIYVDESQYSHIRVHQISREPDVRNLQLDKLLHSTIVMNDPSSMQYGYERIYAAITREMAAGVDSLNTLTIGGGGYVFPRYIESLWPRSRTEVVEIDPAVTTAALAAFGLDANHELLIHHEDGRAFIRQILERKRRGEAISRYDSIYLDVFNDYSVPYQLTTVEFLQQVDELLAEDGAYLMNMIDVFAEGLFLGSMIKTMSDVFPHVVVFAEGVAVSRQPHVRNTFILAGTKQPVDFSRAISEYDARIGLYRLTETDLAEARSRSGTRVLTDDWAPVENFLAPVVKHASREIAANVLQSRAAGLLRDGKQEAAMQSAKRALEFFPDAERAHGTLGDIYLASGDMEDAIRHYRGALEIRPSWTSVRVNLATAFARHGELEEAERELTEVVQLEPRNASAFSNLGIVLMQQGRTEAAVAACRQAIAAQPDYPDAHNNLGVVLFRSNRVPEAVKQFQEALRLAPGHHRARENLQRAQSALRSESKNTKDANSRQ